MVSESRERLSNSLRRMILSLRPIQTFEAADTDEAEYQELGEYQDLDRTASKRGSSDEPKEETKEEPRAEDKAEDIE
eukprot:10623051-Karenia_brevis.AAC.1